jgi:hypothetical protein
VDWLVEANASEKRTVSIFRAEVIMLGIEGLNRVAGREVWGKEPISTEWGRDWSQANGETPSRHQWGRGWVQETKWALFRARGTGWCLSERLSPFFQVTNDRLPCPSEREVIFPVHVVEVELDLYRFPYDPVHPSRLLGQNAGVLQLYPMA